MFVMNLIDVEDNDTNYGVIICNNDDISTVDIQDKIFEIKNKFNIEDYDWVINDVIKCLPKEWNIEWYQHISILRI